MNDQQSYLEDWATERKPREEVPVRYYPKRIPLTQRIGLWAVVLILVFCAGMFVGRSANAQTVLRWNEDRLTWTAPAQCADGSPLTDCPITGYAIEGARSATSLIWLPVASVGPTARAHTVTGVAAGENCYRMRALSAAGHSTPSNVSCSTATAPVPGAPTLQTIDTVAMSVRADWERLSFVPSQQVGTVEIGVECDPKRALAPDWYAIPVTAVRWSGSNKPANVVARCGAAEVAL